MSRRRSRSVAHQLPKLKRAVPTAILLSMVCCLIVYIVCAMEAFSMCVALGHRLCEIPDECLRLFIASADLA
eukprot:scaffold1913_cov257-Pinguiococcus_pyrenoidosus.AAC.6